MHRMERTLAGCEVSVPNIIVIGDFIMTQRQAYIAAYYFLFPYYYKTKNEDLIGLLSNMNPFLWTDGKSAVPSTYEDWLNCAARIDVEKFLNAEQAFNVMA